MKRRIYEYTKVIIAVVALIAVAVFIAAKSFNDTEYVVTVTDKERIVNDESSKYLVFAEDEYGNSIVFENTDAVLRGKWNSSDIQGQLKEGHTYTVTVVGFRVPFLSMYQNIIEIEEQTDE